MKTMLKKALLAALPLAGLLLTAPAAFAHDSYHRHHHWENRRHCQPYHERGWRERWRHDDDDYRPGWQKGRSYYNDDSYYRSRYDQPFYATRWWWR